MSNSIYSEEEIKYSKLLSSLFCSTSIIALSILCLLNNPILDMYGAICLLKTVLPASFCFWFIGFVIGKILDGKSEKIIEQEKVDEKKAYEIPSMFAGNAEDIIDDEFGDLL